MENSKLDFPKDKLKETISIPEKDLTIHICGNISPEEVIAQVELLVKKELNKGRRVTEIALVEVEDMDELDVMFYSEGIITRIRRITGYLSKADNFNEAKRAELIDRKPQVKC